MMFRRTMNLVCRWNGQWLRGTRVRVYWRLRSRLISRLSLIGIGANISRFLSLSLAAVTVVIAGIPIVVAVVVCGVRTIRVVGVRARTAIGLIRGLAYWMRLMVYAANFRLLPAHPLVIHRFIIPLDLPRRPRRHITPKSQDANRAGRLGTASGGIITLLESFGGVENQGT